MADQVGGEGERCLGEIRLYAMSGIRRISGPSLHGFDVTPEERIAELERSHDELRGVVIAAGRHVKRFPRNPGHTKLLIQLRQVLREARVVRYGPTGKPVCKESAASAQ